MKLTPLDRDSAMRAAIALMRGEKGRGLPESVELYIVGKVDKVPACDLARLPEGFASSLHILRDLCGGDDAREMADLLDRLEATRPRLGAPQSIRHAPPLPGKSEAQVSEPCAAVCAVGELCIEFMGTGTVQFRGSRAQLESEGFIPDSIRWPEGCAAVWWRAGRLRYGLRRCRPQGFKGPMKAWVRGDHWALTCFDSHDFATRDVQRQSLELERAVYRASAQGRAELHAMCRRSVAARGDACFQAFMEQLLPEAMQRRRRRTARPLKAVPAGMEGGAA